MTPYRRIWALLALALTSCIQLQPVAPTVTAPSDALITDANLDNASSEIATTELDVQGVEEGSIPDGEQLALPSDDTSLTAQAVLPNVGGYIAYLRVVKGSSSTTWQIWLSNQSTDQKTLVYEGTRTITSTTVNVSGTVLYFVAQAAAGSSNNEVYKLTLPSKAVAKLTSTSTTEADVSTSAGGNTVVWSGINPSTNKRAVYLRDYSGSTFSQKILGISNGEQLEPTVSADGAYIAFVRSTSSVQVIRFQKSNSAYLTVSTPPTSVNVRSPSVSNGGLKVAWGEDGKTGQSSAIKVKTISSGSVASGGSSSSSRIRQPQLTSDGAYLTYSVLYNGTLNVTTKNLANGQLARLTSDTSPSITNVEMFWQKGAYSAPKTVTIQGTVSIGSAPSALSSNVDTSDSGKRTKIRVTETLSSPNITTISSLRDMHLEAAQTGSVDVIVELDVPFTPEGDLSSSEVQEQRQAIATAQEALLEELPDSTVRAAEDLTTVPTLILTVTAAGLNVLENSDVVEDVNRDMPLYPTLSESVALIGGNTAWDSGYDGSSWTVAILDTGIDTSHPFLSSHIVAEACFVSDTSCPNGTGEQVGRGASVPASNESHGSHVAGIAAGRNPGFSGVARNANIMAVDVFSTYNGQLVTQYSDVIRGLEYVYLQRNAYRIASVNMSLGSGSYTSTCDNADASVTAAVNNLRSVDIATVASSGNNSYTNAMGFPACISSVVSVGATGDGSEGTSSNQVVSFSNSSPSLDFLAPGAGITSSVPGGSYEIKQGTSMAAPHVAGAWAVLKQRFPSSSVDDIYNRLQANGVAITDSRNGIIKTRIDVYRALGSPAVPAPPIRVKLFSTTTGALVSEVAAGSSGSYSFGNVPVGRYFVTAYGDKDRNGAQGGTELAGGFGRAAVPQEVNASSGTYAANIVISTPTEVEPNNDRNTNNFLLQTTSITGSVAGTNHDYFKILIPVAGTYEIETTGGCTGSRADTILDLYSASGSVLSSNDDGASESCSLITYSFGQPGTYFLKVRGYADGSGMYTVTLQR